MNMNRFISCIAITALGATSLWAADSRSKEVGRVDAAQKVLKEIMATPDKGIPDKVLAASDCVAIIPSELKGGFVFGANYGKGVATCRLTNNHWSAPAPIRIEGGSWGLQIGGQAVDLVMTIMNKDGMEHLLASKFKIGADASAAAGPVGREAGGDTDWKMRAEVLTYSRARGIFAGITLNGAVLKQDTDDTVALYGNEVNFRDILTGKVADPRGTRNFVSEVARYFSLAKAHERGETAGNATMGGAAGTATSTHANSNAETSTPGVAGNADAQTQPAKPDQQ